MGCCPEVRAAAFLLWAEFQNSCRKIRNAATASFHALLDSLHKPLEELFRAKIIQNLDIYKIGLGSDAHVFVFGQ